MGVADLAAGEPLLGEFAGEVLGQLGAEDAVGDELALLGDQALGGHGG